jgi:hypothetical protein
MAEQLAPAVDPQDLRQIRTLDQVVDFLADELDWPIDAQSLEEASFDYTPQELGVPPDQVPKLLSLRQLRPLVVNQPWGIFFLEFSGPRLAITPLRRLLQALLRKKRAGGDGSRKAWDLDDLLFIITTDTGDSVELHFVAFFEDEGPTSEIRSLPWRPSQSPDQHLKRVATELLPHLAWPEDTEGLDGWRQEWRLAFKLRHGEAIRSAAQLAERMAETAHALRERVADALGAEHGRGPFSTLLDEVRTELVANVDEARFADMCAQTLVYGTLASRITDPDAFGASPTLSAVPLSNPFLAAFFEQVHEQTAELEIEDGGLEQLVADLRRSNVEAILDQFGSTAKGGDPVIHFYEEFLTRYDRRMRADAGAFYTPQPVVQFIVRSVDQLLRTHFGLPAGVADPATWAEVMQRIGGTVPSGVDPQSPFISMLDPATGTGTFLVEWLRQAHTSLKQHELDVNWPVRLHDFVLPSMHAFELMLAPYAIAHLKVALELEHQGGGDGAVNILLTDTLDHPAPVQKFEILSDPVAAEGQRASDLKRNARFTVIVGNPPYDREQRSANSELEAKRKGGVVRYGVPGISPLLDDVVEPLRSAGLGQHAKNVYNDYVYFWRWATWQATERRAGPGIVAFITASSYLDGKSFGGLRQHLRDVFDELWIVDLGGEGRGAQTEENVFDIRTPVAICIGVRRAVAGSHRSCGLRYLRLEGTRQDKFAGLYRLSLDDSEFQEVAGRGLDRFTPRGDSEYQGWPEITDVFPWIHSGSQLKRTWPIGATRSVLERRWDALCEMPRRLRGEALRETGFRSLSAKVRPLLDPSAAPLKPIGKLRPADRPEAILRYGYRSFDRQWVIADNRLADRPRPDLWAVSGRGQIFLTTLTSTQLGRGPILTATPYVPDLDHFSGRGAKNVMPLWRDPDTEEPNITAGLLDALADALGEELAPKDLATYVYSLLGTGAFSERFADELSEGAGPVRVPLTADRELFQRATELGDELLWWHTWGERFGPDDDVELSSGTAREIEPVHGYPEGFYYDDTLQRLSVGSGTFGPVAPEVWAFEVSGLMVVQSWLGYRMAERKGKKSSPLDRIRPQRWSFSQELLRLLAIVEHTIELTPKATALLEAIVTSSLIDPVSFPQPAEAEQKAPK